MFETETVGPFLFQKVKWLDGEGGAGGGGGGLMAPLAPSGYNPV